MLTPHSNTDTSGTVTCLPVAAVRAGECRSAVGLVSVFFSGYAFGYGPKPTGATYIPSVAEVSSALSRRANKFAQKNGKNNTYKSTFIIPTL